MTDKKQWLVGQRVTVTHPEHPMFGKTGMVHRPQMRDDGAWVEMHDPLPPDLRCFPEGDPRANHALLFPEDIA